MELDNEVYGAIDRYFSVLSHLGYKSYSQVDRLLVLCFIEDLLDGPMSEFITEDDYGYISNGLYCLYGTCMIPFPDYKLGITEPSHRVLDSYRIMEVGNMKASESFNLRAKV